MFSKRILSSVTTIALCASFIIPANIFAAASFTGGTNVSGGLNVQVSITDLQVTGVDAGDTVPVFLYVPAGSLSMTTTTGLTFTGASSGQRLYFSGTRTDVNNALATLKYTHSSAGTYTLEASIIGAGQIYDPSTQHIYEVVNHGSPISATAARSAATSRTINGVTGYLANITSADENTFVAARITQDGWFGASDAAVEGDWVWLDGPESDDLFWQGVADGTAFGYENWANNEPNQSGNEDCSQFYANGSGWNDLPCSSTLNYYIVEYGEPGNLPSVAGDTLDITLSADSTPPTITNVTSDKANGSYTIGEVIDIDVTFSEAVTSTGNVTVTLETGTTDRTCTFTVTSATTGTCNYTVQAGDTSADLTVSSISGTIADGAANAMVNFVPTTNLAANKAIVIDTTGPVISDILVVIKHPPGADISWTTDEGATSYIEYGLTNAYGSNTILDADLDTAHSQTITSLAQVTTYHYRITSEDALGNSTTTSDYVFTTSGATPGVRIVESPREEPKPTVMQESDEEPETDTTPTNTDSDQSNATSEIEQESINTDSSVSHGICQVAEYVKNPIKLYRKNNSEDVKLLEQFLNKYEDANLPVDGYYSREDFKAVVKWQEKHANDILTPWGLKRGTGYIYKTSLAKIKEIEEGVCK